MSHAASSVLAFPLFIAITAATAVAQEAASAPGAMLDALRSVRELERVLPCDTWVALPDATRDGITILAKNSDRPLFDSQPLVFHPGEQWRVDARLDVGRLEIAQVPETWATLGSSPYWCWGYEEGINEHGVAIGNEGVWTRDLARAQTAAANGEEIELGLTGMDLIRLGLERGKTARQALDVIRCRGALRAMPPRS